MALGVCAPQKSASGTVKSIEARFACFCSTGWAPKAREVMIQMTTGMTLLEGEVKLAQMWETACNNMGGMYTFIQVVCFLFALVGLTLFVFQKAKGQSGGMGGMGGMAQLSHKFSLGASIALAIFGFNPRAVGGAVFSLFDIIIGAISTIFVAIAKLAGAS